VLGLWLPQIVRDVSGLGPFGVGVLSAIPNLVAAAGGIAVMTTVANLGGFLGPYAVGVLKQRTGSFQEGLLLLAGASLAGAALALWMRRSPILRGESPR
jgi:ACS family tartrate transporter-like MFS transporter